MVEENIGLQLKFSKLITYAFHTIQEFAQCADHGADFGNFRCPLVNKKHLEKGCFAQVVGNLGNGMEAVKTLSPPNPTYKQLQTGTVSHPCRVVNKPIRMQMFNAILNAYQKKPDSWTN